MGDVLGAIARKHTGLSGVGCFVSPAGQVRPQGEVHGSPSRQAGRQNGKVTLPVETLLASVVSVALVHHESAGKST